MAVQQQPLDNYYYVQNKEEIETSVPVEVEKAAKKVKSEKIDKVNLAQTMPPTAPPLAMDS